MQGVGLIPDWGAESHPLKKKKKQAILWQIQLELEDGHIKKYITQNCGIIHKKNQKQDSVHHLMSSEKDYIVTKTLIIFIKIHSFVSPLIFN